MEGGGRPKTGASARERPVRPRKRPLSVALFDVPTSGGSSQYEGLPELMQCDSGSDSETDEANAQHVPGVGPDAEPAATAVTGAAMATAAGAALAAGAVGFTPGLAPCHHCDPRGFARRIAGPRRLPLFPDIPGGRLPKPRQSSSLIVCFLSFALRA